MTKILLIVKAIVILVRLHKRGKLPAAIQALRQQYPDVSHACHMVVVMFGICQHPFA